MHGIFSNIDTIFYLNEIFTENLYIISKQCNNRIFLMPLSLQYGDTVDDNTAVYHDTMFRMSYLTPLQDTQENTSPPMPASPGTKSQRKSKKPNQSIKNTPKIFS